MLHNRQHRSLGSSNRKHQRLGPAQRAPLAGGTYFTSTVAPASVNFFLMFSASSLETPSLIGLGAPSTRSLASFRPRLVTSRTALITLILFEPTAVRTTLNSVFSSAGAAAAPAPAAPAIITGAAAAADTPSTSSSFFTSSEASSSVSPLTSSTILSTFTDIVIFILLKYPDFPRSPARRKALSLPNPVNRRMPGIFVLSQPVE